MLNLLSGNCVPTVSKYENISIHGFLLRLIDKKAYDMYFINENLDIRFKRYLFISLDDSFSAVHRTQKKIQEFLLPTTV